MQIISRKYRRLASVQAALIMNIVHGLLGLDKIGDIYGLKGWAIAQEMELFDGNAHVLSERVRNARNFTAWCLFGINRYVLYILAARCMTNVGASVILLGNYVAHLPSLNLQSLRFLIHLWMEPGTVRYGLGILTVKHCHRRTTDMSLRLYLTLESSFARYVVCLLVPT